MASVAASRRPTASTIEKTNRAPRWRRAVALAGAALVGTGLGWVALDQGHGGQGTSSDPTPAPSSAIPFTTPTTGQDVDWTPFAGLSLPTSRTDGPRCRDHGLAACFTHSPRGAAFAAVNVLVRTFPFAGSRVFGPTIRDQVTGRHTGALFRLTWQAYRQTAQVAAIRDGAPIPSSGGWVAGYRLDRSQQPPSDKARVRVLIRQDGEGSDAGFVEYTVTLLWREGDWRLLAPAWGDWRSAARAVPSADPGDYRGFEQEVIG